MGIAIVSKEPVIELGPLRVNEQVGPEPSWRFTIGSETAVLPKLSSRIWDSPEPSINLALDLTLVVAVLAVGVQMKRELDRRESKQLDNS